MNPAKKKPGPVQKRKTNKGQRVRKSATHRTVSRTRKREGAKIETKRRWVSDDELVRLRETLREAQETLDAIRSGEVDAVVVSGSKGNQIYSLTGAEQPYRIYVEHMQEGAVTVSADGLILYCNQKFADLMQLPLERVISSTLTSHLPEAAWQKLAGVFNGKQNFVKHECELQRANGITLPVHLTANRLPMEEQSLMCLVVTDLSIQKQHEELRLAKEVAEKANLAKDDFLAALSHELRTPLTPILMTAAALEQNPNLSEETRESLTLIRRNAELEARLIDDLLDLTRIAHGKLELRPSNLDHHTIVQRAVDICRSEFSAKSQKLSLKLEANHFQSAGDPDRIQQAVWNLIRNAVKFTREHGSIIIRTANPSPHSIMVEVKDSGIGFEPGSVEKLFQAFEQGGRHITRQFGGLGLGLAITRSIVHAHGGTINAESKGPGKGATFTLEFPLAPCSAVPIPAPALSVGLHLKPSKRILLVEDHKDTRTSLEFLLQRIRHDVKSAASANEALKLATENVFDLVISDVGLPDQNGFDLMRQLKAQYNLKGIGLSGYGMEEDITRSEEAGFVRYLTKPVSFERLKQLISEI
jgi:PAS domain S-box-containing protein